jgi:hypothetical protein
LRTTSLGLDPTLAAGNPPPPRQGAVALDDLGDRPSLVSGSPHRREAPRTPRHLRHPVERVRS